MLDDLHFEMGKIKNRFSNQKPSAFPARVYVLAETNYMPKKRTIERNNLFSLIILLLLRTV